MNQQTIKEMKTEDFSALTRTIMTIIDDWGLSATEELKILSLPEKTPTRALRKYRDGLAFPATPEVFERIEHILGIFEALRTSYPHNKQMAMIWMSKCNKHFVTRPPIMVIREDGLSGLVQVRGHLDCTFDWFSS
ncbi:hypothetical protein MNBD_GAMMA25-1295 [hydrothermal vent metagenome]|uniref:Antitoxin Xre/MbcA/ParS-like toxin-binding domain-containing protein n=1 Tax=hydrothermal vent metagenome TaxID=652676 RepID=A0A3B1BU27_9ZZZZ